MFLRFRGGKGTACLCGTVLRADAGARAALLALMFLIGMIWNRASILPLLTALVYAPLYLLRTSDWRGTIALALIFPAMLWAHRSALHAGARARQTFRQFLFGRHEPQRGERGMNPLFQAHCPQRGYLTKAVRSQLLQHSVRGGAAALARSGRRAVHAQPRPMNSCCR